MTVGRTRFLATGKRLLPVKLIAVALVERANEKFNTENRIERGWQKAESWFHLRPQFLL